MLMFLLFFLFIQLMTDPVHSLFEPFSGLAWTLHDSPRFFLFSQFVKVEIVDDELICHVLLWIFGQILLVGQEQINTVFEFLMIQSFSDILSKLINSINICAVNDPNHHLDIIIIMVHEFFYLVATSNVPCCDFYMIVYIEGLNVESDGGNGVDGVFDTEFQTVKKWSFAGCVQASNEHFYWGLGKQFVIKVAPKASHLWFSWSLKTEETKI